MDWKGRKKSSNVEDRRGLSSGKMVVGGIGGIILLLVFTLLGGNPVDIINNMQNTDTEVDSSYQATAEEEELAEFVSVVLAETEEVWTMLFKEQGGQYDYPTLVLYSGMVDSACGVAGSSAGPFYCSGDQKVYLDLSFFNELRKNYNAPGDFAIAYVVAHEVGHHVQMLLGIMDQLNELRQKLSKTEYNNLMVRLELQADYFAGVWAHYVNRIDLLEKGDLEEALNAASAVGDDRLQKQNQGYVVPDSFTHGTSEQRQRWFYKGFTNGTIAGGDTFNMDID
ncbi:MAG: neutral zinc metallopeptidase [Candidatus Atribacteria bacterium]|nr:neutral zinc metallopeptidase [Candidatus Atribacteria bacterium]